jgi:hypothetical protein
LYAIILVMDQMKLQTSIDLEKSQSDVSEKDKQEVTPPIKLNDSKDAKETKNESDDDKACEVSNNSLKESENDTEQIVQEHTMPEKKTSGNVEDASVPVMRLKLEKLMKCFCFRDLYFQECLFSSV